MLDRIRNTNELVRKRKQIGLRLTTKNYLLLKEFAKRNQTTINKTLNLVLDGKLESLLNGIEL